MQASKAYPRRSLGLIRRCPFGACFLQFAMALAACVWTGTPVRAEPPLPAAAPVLGSEPVDFARDILPVLQKNCTACHNAKLSEGGLNLETRDSVLKGGDSGPGIVAKDPGASTVWMRATGGEEPLMPPEDNSAGAEPLTPAQLGLLRQWIEQGAPAGGPVGPSAVGWQSIPNVLQPIYSVAISPDGQWVADGRGNVVAIYDLTVGRKVAELIDPAVEEVTGTATTDVDIVQSLAFSPDGLRIATGGYRVVKLWRRTAPTIDRSTTPLAHAAGLVTVRADGKQLALVNAIGEIEIWDAETNQPLRTLAGQYDTVNGLAYGGDRLFSSDAHGRLVAWDADTGSRLAALDTGRTLTRLVTAPGGDWIAAVDTEKHVATWRFGGADAETSKEGTFTFRAVELAGLGGVENATDAAFAGAGTLLAVGTEAGAILLIQLEDGKEVRRLEHGAAVDATAVNADGSQIATGGRDGITRLWTTASGAPAGVLEGDVHLQLATARAARDAARQQADIQRLAARTPELETLVKQETEAVAKVQAARDAAAEKLAADEKKVADAAAQLKATDAMIATAKEETEAPDAAAAKAAATKLTELEMQLEMQKKAVAELEQAKTNSAMELAQQERTLATARQAAERAAAALPEHAAMVERARRRGQDAQRRLAAAEQRTAAAHAAVIAIAYSGDVVATADAYGAVRSYRTATGQPLATFEGAAGFDVGLQFLDGQTLCAFGRGAPPNVWTLQPRWELERTIGSLADSPLSDRVTAMDFRPDGLSLAAGSGPPSRFGEIKIFAVETGQLLRDIGPIHSDTVAGVGFSPDGRTLASAAADKTIRLTDVATGQVTGSLEGHTHHVLAVAWQDDGQTAASASADASVKIWSPVSGEQRRTIGGFPKEVAAVAFVGSSSQIVTAGADGQVRLYNAADGSHVRNFAAGSDFQHAVAVTPDGTRVVAGGQDGILRAWSVNDGSLLHEWK